MPRLPTFPARWVLEDPRQRPYFVFWTSGDEGDVPFVLKMERAEDGDAVLVTLESGGTYRIGVLRRPLPRGTGTTLLYLCPVCKRPRRHLYRLSRSGAELVDYFGLRCQACAGLRFRSQGRYRRRFGRRLFALFLRGPRTTIPIRRRPWDPRAVSDPQLVAENSPLWEARSTDVGHYRTGEEKRMARVLRALRRHPSVNVQRP